MNKMPASHDQPFRTFFLVVERLRQLVPELSLLPMGQFRVVEESRSHLLPPWLVDRRNARRMGGTGRIGIIGLTVSDYEDRYQELLSAGPPELAVQYEQCAANDAVHDPGVLVFLTVKVRGSCVCGPSDRTSITFTRT